jgi:hypothetical protein
LERDSVRRQREHRSTIIPSSRIDGTSCIVSSSSETTSAEATPSVVQTRHLIFAVSLALACAGSGGTETTDTPVDGRPPLGDPEYEIPPGSGTIDGFLDCELPGGRMIGRTSWVFARSENTRLCQAAD